MKDIYYSNYKERVKKKLIKKLQTTVITEGEKKGKVLHNYNNFIIYISQFYMFQPKNSHAIAEIGLFYKWLIN